MDSIQIVINKAMWVICTYKKSINIRDLQKTTNWMSIRKAAKYHSLMGACLDIDDTAAGVLVHQADDSPSGEAARP